MTTNGVLDLTNMTPKRPSVILPNGAEYPILYTMDLGSVGGLRLKKLYERMEKLQDALDPIEPDDKVIAQINKLTMTLTRIICPDMTVEDVEGLSMGMHSEIQAHFLVKSAEEARRRGTNSPLSERLNLLTTST